MINSGNNYVSHIRFKAPGMGCKLLIAKYLRMKFPEPRQRYMDGDSYFRKA